VCFVLASLAHIKQKKKQFTHSIFEPFLKKKDERPQDFSVMLFFKNLKNLPPKVRQWKKQAGVLFCVEIREQNIGLVEHWNVWKIVCKLIVEAVNFFFFFRRFFFSGDFFCSCPKSWLSAAFPPFRFEVFLSTYDETVPLFSLASKKKKLRFTSFFFFWNFYRKKKSMDNLEQGTLFFTLTGLLLLNFS